jgi:hypothetical protein
VSADEKSRSYVELVRDELNQYTSSLLRENEKLRAMTTSLESDKRRLELEVFEARSVLEQKDELRRAVESFDAVRTGLAADVASARRERDAATQELDRLRSQLDEVAQENEQYVAQYHQIEQHSSNLSNLYVASYQLHSSVERAAVLSTIQEIVVNLIGSEEVAVLELDDHTGRYRLAAAFGVDEARLLRARATNRELGHSLDGGVIYLNDSAGHDEDSLTAVIPLRIKETIIGAIVVFRLLDHKQDLQAVDHELFELLALHASKALYCANLHELAGAATVLG